MIRILHLSDLQCGDPYRPEVARALLRLSTEVAPDLTVVSGDLTQRAKAREFREAKSFMDALAGGPVVTTPGNHDVPLWRVWERIVQPYRQWTRVLGAELDSVTRIPGLTCVAVNSAAPRRRIVAGHLDSKQVGWAREAFAKAPEGDLRVLVTHHHFVPTPDGRGGRPLSTARRLLTTLEEWGVDLVLGGHVHQTHLASSRALVPGQEGRPGIPLISSGTAASSRGRGAEAGQNSVNLIRLDEGSVEVEVYRHDPEQGSFQPGETHIFSPGPVSTITGPGAWGTR